MKTKIIVIALIGIMLLSSITIQVSTQTPSLDHSTNVIGFDVGNQNLEVTKTVYDEVTSEWVDEIYAGLNETLRFRVDITYHNIDETSINNCRLANITILDILSAGLIYVNNSTVEETWYDGNEVFWDLNGVTLVDNESFTLEYYLVTIAAGNQTNTVHVTGVESHSGLLREAEDTVLVVIDDLEDDMLVADFTFSPENPQYMDIVQFTDMSTGASLSYWWDFGDGYYSDLQNPRHCFYNNGTYIVSLTVRDQLGQTDIINKTIRIPNIVPEEVLVDDDFDSSTPGWQVTHFDKIQDAIDAANPADTVYVYSGTYYENVVVNKKIVLIGEDKTTTIIDGENVVRKNVVFISSDEVKIKGFTIQHGFYYGIKIESDYNYIIDNIIIDNVYPGVDLDGSFNCVQFNAIENNNKGITASRFSDNIITNNIIRNNTDTGIKLYESSNNTINSNTIEGNGYKGIMLHYGTNNTVSENIIANNADSGIVFADNFNSICDLNTVTDNGGLGIIVYSDSANCIVSNNYIAQNQDGRGLGIWNANSISITENIIIDHDGDGVDLDGQNCTVIGNEISKNRRGIIVGSDYCIISENTITNNTFRGIDVIYGSNACYIHHNNFIDNAQNAYDTSSSGGDNFWDNGYPSGGNYWDDYSGVDSNSDGIGDTPYNIPPFGNERDNYPLIEPYGYNMFNHDIEVKKFVKEGNNSDYSDEGITIELEDYVTFKIEVTNTGDIPLEVLACDELPPELVYNNNARVNGIPHEPDFIDFNSYYWNLGEIDPDENVIITFRAGVTATGIFTNIAWAHGYNYYQGNATGNDTTYVIVQNNQDITPPISNCNLTCIAAPFNGYYTEDVIVNIVSHDDFSGVSQIFYCIKETDENGNSADIYGPEIPVDGDSVSFIIDATGYYKIYYYAVDNAGNQEPIKSRSIKIDKTAPATEAILPPYPGKYYTASVTVTLQALDKLSGIENTYYSVDIDPTWNIYNKPFIVSGTGSHTVRFYSVDNAGNIEIIKTVTFGIFRDIIEPVIPSR